MDARDLGLRRHRLGSPVSDPGYIRRDTPRDMIRDLSAERRLLLERVVELTRELGKRDERITELENQLSEMRTETKAKGT